MTTEQVYIPALRFTRLTPLYDPLLRWLFREDYFKRSLIAQAQIQPGHAILDLGCGTGTLMLLLHQAHPDAHIVGIDIDPAMLAIARRKAERSRTAITLEQGSVTALPFASNSFDRVLTSLVLHHLTTAQKQQALDEALRVLRPGGAIHIADFGRPHTLPSRVISRLTRHFEQVADNIAGRLPAMLQRAGVTGVHVVAQHMTPLGTIAFLRARKPETLYG